MGRFFQNPHITSHLLPHYTEQRVNRKRFSEICTISIHSLIIFFFREAKWERGRGGAERSEHESWSMKPQAEFWAPLRWKTLTGWWWPVKGKTGWCCNATISPLPVRGDFQLDVGRYQLWKEVVSLVDKKEIAQWHAGWLLPSSGRFGAISGAQMALDIQ